MRLIQGCLIQGRPYVRALYVRKGVRRSGYFTQGLGEKSDLFAYAEGMGSRTGSELLLLAKFFRGRERRGQEWRRDCKETTSTVLHTVPAEPEVY